MRRLIRWLVAAAMAAAGPTTATSAQSAPTEERRTLEVDGVERGYLVFLPPSYRPEHPAPLVLVFHGGGGRATGIAPHTGFSLLAEREGFVAVYPDGQARTAVRDEQLPTPDRRALQAFCLLLLNLNEIAYVD